MTTIHLRYCDIPVYLHGGDFYRNLNGNDPESVIEVPADCFQSSGEKATDLDEFSQLLRTMVFWMLDEYPQGVHLFCIQNDVSVWREAVAHLPQAEELNILPPLLLAYSTPSNIPLVELIKLNRWDLILYALFRMEKSPVATALAAKFGNLRLLEYTYADGYGWHESTCRGAAENGHVDCLQFAHDNGCPWDSQVYVFAANNGHVQCMQYAHQQGLEWHPETCNYAVTGGHVDCLQFAHENGCAMSDDVFADAVEHGRLDCLTYAHQQGLQWTSDVCLYAASYGHLDCLMYAHENGCPWDGKEIVQAALYGNVDCIQYAFDNGAGPLTEEACNLAASKSQIECLELLHKLGAPWSEETCGYAVMHPEAACLQFLHERGCPWDESTTEAAAVQSRLPALRYAMEQGCPHDENLVTYASGECLQYLVEVQRLPLSPDCFVAVLLAGDLASLQFLFDHGCPLPAVFIEEDRYEDTIEYYDDVFAQDHPDFLQCVQLAVQHGWVPDQHFVDFVSDRDPPCAEWLASEGY